MEVSGELHKLLLYQWGKNNQYPLIRRVHRPLVLVQMFWRMGLGRRKEGGKKNMPWQDIKPWTAQSIA